jgi:hypothetical protein
MANVNDWITRIGYYDTAATSRVRALLYGDTGVGKTRFAGTFPKAFFLDSDKGGRTLRELHVPHLPLERGERVFELIMDVMRKVRAKETPFEVETLVFDSLTSLTDMLMIEAMKYPPPGKMSLDANKQKPEWDHYSLIQNRLKTIVKTAQDLDVNIVATCGTKLERDEVRGTFVGKPNILGSFRDLVGYEFDDVIYMTIEGGIKDRKYVAYTTRVSYYEAKSRSGLQSRYEDPTYTELYGSQKRPSAAIGA